VRRLSANYSEADLLAKWEDFLSSASYKLEILMIADGYPDRKSLSIEYGDMDRYDPDWAMYVTERPDSSLSVGRRAVKGLMPPGSVAHDVNIRIRGLPRDSRVDIRNLRSKHLGKLIAVEGLVRKATEVRPRMVHGLFHCARCDAEIWEEQDGMAFKEPMMCSNPEGSCNKTATRFILDQENSIFIDTQKIEVQESPEGLRGGAQPERLTGFLEDDIAGQISPGNRITLNGVLRSVQKGGRDKSSIFDIHLDVHSMEFAQHEYDEIQITEEDEQMILEASRDPELFQNVVRSVSPTIYGLEMEKKAIALQLFGGCSKDMDDGTKIRGDIHILMIGDPGVAKCVAADTHVTLWGGELATIGELVDEALENGSEPVDDGVHAPLEREILTLGKGGKLRRGRTLRAWRREAPSHMLRMQTASGRELEVTPTHPLMTREGWKAAAEIEMGTELATVSGFSIKWSPLAEKEELPAPEWVYDLEVEDSHNYVGNGIVSHNSQLLRYMSSLAPRGIYASGKSASAAGLCVAPETMISTDEGEMPIVDFVEPRLEDPEEVEPGVWCQKVSGNRIMTLSMQRVRSCEVSAVWKIKTPPFLVEIVIEEGPSLILTPETPIMAKKGSCIDWTKSIDIEVGDQTVMYDPCGPTMFPIRWGNVCAVNRLEENLPPYVYDLTVEHEHAFLANGFTVHNTAAAVKDDFGDGRWTLEAGALVLADKGLACIDELDKMSTQDRSSLHEAMESQRISVAKAGITATLQCRCSLLAAANPKYGRFEEYTSIAEQIELPPALMSRFDLIFVMTDKPEQKRDQEITQHILKAHRRGQARRYQGEEGMTDEMEKILEETSDIKPIYDIEFLRKYAAYSKRIVPVLSTEAVQIIESYYLDIRRMGEGDDSSVPITARQLEAFVRLSEASARSRLSPVVEEADAQRAVRLVRYYLEKIAGTTSGQLDIDMMATGVSKSQRDRIPTIKRIIQRYGDDSAGVSEEELILHAMEEGIPEREVLSILQKMKSSGEIFSPREGIYRMVR